MEAILSIVIIYILYRVVKTVLSGKKKVQTPEITFNISISGSTGHYTDFEHHKRPSGKPAIWYGANQSVTVHGYEISCGLIYVGETLFEAHQYDNDASLINPNLAVSPAEPWQGAEEMHYWPHYGNISAQCRGAYLQWLVGGRSEPEAYIGYVFLFFYGLERRLFLDGPQGAVQEFERTEIIQEVIRLLGIYGGNRSFRSYANNFLAMEWIFYQSDRPIPAYLDFDDSYCLKAFQVILAQHVADGKPIPAELARQWLSLHPEFCLRTPARRCAQEFQELFVHRYQEKFGAGLLVKPNKTILKLEYYAASPSLRGQIMPDIADLPNPFILTGPIKKIAAVAEACTVDLESYSRFLGRKGNAPNTLTALALLPKELLKQNPKIQQAQAHLVQVCVDGIGLVAIGKLYEYFDDKTLSQMNKKEAETLGILLENINFGMAPDIRFHNIKPNLDEKVVIFPYGHGVDFCPSKEFRIIGIILRLGAMVSQIDGNLAPAEETLLQSLILDNRHLTKIEKDSLLAFLHWCLATPQETTGIKQKLAEVSTAEKTAISHILISVAYADGHIDPKEIKQLEKLYVNLGLNKEQVTHDLHALAANEPVTVAHRDQDTSFSLPKLQKEPVAIQGFHLNEELMRIREEETRQVKGVLEEIFTDQFEDSEDVALSPPVQVASPVASLTQAHQDFFHHLLKQEIWDRKAIHELCRELDLMPDGAMEVLNEWAFNTANAPLIDGDDPIYVDIELAREILHVE